MRNGFPRPCSMTPSGGCAGGMIVPPSLSRTRGVGSGFLRVREEGGAENRRCECSMTSVQTLLQPGDQRTALTPTRQRWKSALRRSSTKESDTLVKRGAVQMHLFKLNCEFRSPQAVFWAEGISDGTEQPCLPQKAY